MGLFQRSKVKAFQFAFRTDGAGFDKVTQFAALPFLMELVAHALKELGIVSADLILKERVLCSAEGSETGAVMGFDEVKRHPVCFATTPQRNAVYVWSVSSCL